MAEAIAQGRFEGESGMDQDNRESWLNRVAAGMAPLFEALGTPLPSRVRVAIGFISAGRKSKAIGECWDNRRSADGHFESSSARTSRTLPTQCRRRSRRSSRMSWSTPRLVSRPGTGSRLDASPTGLGLVGPMRATTPSDAFLAMVAPVLVAAGPLPHARLDTGGETTAPKKQAARMLKCEYQVCGYTVRTARKWLSTVGAPLCPTEGHGAMRHDPLDSDQEEPEE